jgi:acyl-[acyl-carrier-protein]-phospholipid O-acyltransferase/long-chain-fatty-acid--[acyl-carrier-protein] ligase
MLSSVYRTGAGSDPRVIYPPMFTSEQRNAEAARPVLIDALTAALRSYGDTIALDDVHRRPVTRRRLLFGAALMGRALARGTQPGDRVGLAGDFTRDRVLALLGLVLFGRVPVLLPAEPVSWACDANLRLARLVVSRGMPLQGAPWPAVAIEDVREALTSWATLRAALDTRLLVAKRWRTPHQDDAVAIGIGDGATATGVTQDELLREARRIANAIEPRLGPGDVVYVMHPIPVSMGLSAGLLPGLLNGACVMLDAGELPPASTASLIGGVGATVLIAGGAGLDRLTPMRDALRAGGLRAMVVGSDVSAAVRDRWRGSGIVVIDAVSADAGREAMA